MSKRWSAVRGKRKERTLQRLKERHRVIIQVVEDDSKVEGGCRKRKSNGYDIVEDFVCEWAEVGQDSV